MNKIVIEENNSYHVIESLTSKPDSKLDLFLKEVLRDKQKLRILEAGCGSASRVNFHQENLRVTGIDISPKQLERNLSLDEKIVGDVQYHPFEPSIYDVIICYWVLEHLPYPILALEGFVDAIVEDGYIILAVPNLLSIKGLLTKFTPQFIHEWIYKLVHGIKNTEEDVGPFRTFLRYSTRPKAIFQFAKNNDLKIVYFETFDIQNSSWSFKGGVLGKVVGLMYRIINIMSKKISLGLLGDSEFIIVLQRSNSKVS